MKQSFTAATIGSLWVPIGLFLVVGGLVATAGSFALSSGTFSIDTAALPAPLDFIASHARTIGPVQSLVGILLSTGGFLLTRKRPLGWWLLVTLSIALIPWFLFLGATIAKASQAGRPVAFPAALPIAFALLALGTNLWALTRPSVTRDLIPSK